LIGFTSISVANKGEILDRLLQLCEPVENAALKGTLSLDRGRSMALLKMPEFMDEREPVARSSTLRGSRIASN
jgi:hypothetical protein